MADSDFDGLADWEELELGTNPFLADTDGDGVKDGVQYKTQKAALELTMLKDLFVPHEGNGYRPMALHPGRILYHAGTAVLLKLLLIGFIVAMPIEAWLAPDVITGQQQKIIALTNDLRTAQNVTPLKESYVLDQAAQAKVTDMFAVNYFAHVSPKGKGAADWLKMFGYNYAVAGENLAMGFVDAEEVVKAWKDSPTHYSNLIDPDFSQIGVALGSGKIDGEETTVISQYFGEPQGTKKVLSSTVTENDSILGNAKVQLSVIERPVPDKKLVRAAVELNPDTEKAEIKVGDESIKLEPTNQNNEWTGSALLSANPAINKVNVPATLIVTDKSNNVRNADVTASVLNVKSNFFNDYNFLKKNTLANSLWSFVSGYYIVVLTMAIIALMINIFVEIRRQHPHLILSTASLIFLLVILVLI